MISMSDALRLAELFCVRLSHDVAGPLGALIGIMEIAREEHPDSETVALGEQTAGELGQRLKLLRSAWGGVGEDIDLARLASLAAPLSSGRLRLDLNGVEAGTTFSPPLARLALNLLLLGAEGLPRGGTVALSGAPDRELVLTISGARAAWPAGFAACLVSADSALETLLNGPRHVQGPLTALLARGYGYRLCMLMPTGSGPEAGQAPPLILSIT